MRKIKILLLAVTVLVAGESFAQKKEKQKKPNLTKAETIVTKGTQSELSAEELTTALEIVDLAATHEKTMTKSRTWYLRGMVYKFIYNSSNEFENISKGDAIKNAGEAFNKSSELGGDSDTYGGNSFIEVGNLWGTLLNEGVGHYNDGNMEEAVKVFEYTSLVKPEDTTGYLYAGSAASDIKDYEAAQRNYRKLVDLKPTEDYYKALISVEKDGLKDTDAALKTIEEAKGVLGDNNTEIGKIEIDILIGNNKVQEAIEKINTAIEAEPENSILVLKKGLLYDRLSAAEKKKDEPNEELIVKYGDEAQQAYKKVTELDPENVTAFFNYSISYNEKAVRLSNELNAMGIRDYNKNKAKYEADAMKYLEQALPLMEEAYRIAPEDADVLFALEQYYTRMKKNDKLKEITQKLESLGLVEED